ncbi:hypothetical protein GCM10010252_19750 [Streptomyces aureoverticillatus]|nr:hypothetical protein GCM10010252_19750 [Streptomyces aureoverticillatus]
MHPRPAVNPRLLALLGVAAVAVLLPLAGASAGPVLHADAKRPAAPPPEGMAERADAPAGEGRAAAPAREGRAAAPEGVGERPSRPQDTPPHPAAPADDAPPPRETTARCGPELSTPDGVDAQTCVLTQGDDTWARTYYRNATGRALKAVLSLMGPKGRTVQMHCAVGAEDEPAVCETPRERTAGAAAQYAAVAEFASESGDALLLRSGSN